MTGFNEVFGGSNIYPSQTTYLALDPLSADVDLQWPIEQAIAGDLVVADIIDVNPVAPGLTIQFPDARQAAQGFSCLLNNIGGNTVSILAADSSSIVTIVAGTVWEIYLIDNTTEAGTWRIFQFGASVSVAVASALAGSGLKAIGSTLNERMVISAHAVNYNIVDADRANVQQWTSGVGQFTLPTPVSVGNDWFTVIKNQGSGNLTVNTAAGLIDGNATLVLAPGQSAWILTDGVNYFSLVGAGTSGGGGSGFNLITIDVSGSGNFTLSGGQLNQIGYKFTGALTGDRHIIVPGTIAEYWVDNETTGAFNLTVGTLAQVSPVTVPQSNRNILYCDGTNVISATTAAIVFPITIGQGGTGATTAPNARTNLGSTAIGDAVFTAASPAAAQAAIQSPPVGRQILGTPSILLSGGGDLSADRTLSLNVVAIAVNNSGTTTLTGPGVDLPWDTELYDVGGWHAGASANFTVPAGVHWVEMDAILTWQAQTGSITIVSFELFDVTLGSVILFEDQINITNPGPGTSPYFMKSSMFSSGVFPVNPGDTLKITGSGSPLLGAQPILQGNLCRVVFRAVG